MRKKGEIVMFEGILLSPQTRSSLNNYLKMNKGTTQSVVLVGEKGLGKRTVANVIAKFLCNYGGSQDIIKHPDFMLVEPTDGLISKGQIEEVQLFANYQSVISPRRVILVDDADMMGVAAANSLLKLLEDYIKTSVFIFVAHKPLIPTIMSRCVTVEFQPPSVEEFLKFLGEEGNEIAMRASGGRIGLYYDLAKDDTFLKVSEPVVRTFEQMLDTRELLTAFHAMKEKDKEYLYDALDQGQRLCLLRLLQDIFFSHYRRLLSESPAVTSLEKNLSHFYDQDKTCQILETIENAVVMSGRKGMFSKNDFFSMLMRMVNDNGGCTKC